MFKLIIIFFMFMVTSFCSFAKSELWMRTENSDSLGLFVFVSEDCPFTRTEVTRKIEGEYLRARVKPTESVGLFIEVDVSCMTPKIADRSVGHVVSYSTSFGTSFFDTIMTYRFPQYGTLAVGSDDSTATSFFIDSITESVEDALTDYLKANMPE